MTVLRTYQIKTLRPDPVNWQTPSDKDLRAAWEAHLRNCDEIKTAFNNYKLTENLHYLADAIRRLDVGNPDAMEEIAAQIALVTSRDRSSMDMDVADACAVRWADNYKRNPSVLGAVQSAYNEAVDKDHRIEKLTDENRLLLGLWINGVAEAASDPKKVKDNMRDRARTRRSHYAKWEKKLPQRLQKREINQRAADELAEQLKKNWKLYEPSPLHKRSGTE